MSEQNKLLDKEVDYFAYWGKAMPGSDGASCHRLLWHSLDVSAVLRELLEQKADLTQRLADSLEISPQALIRWFTFLIALHDIGKFARAFQGLAEPECRGLVEPDLRMSYGRPKHDGLGALLWQYDLKKRLRTEGAYGLDAESVKRPFHKAIQPWLELIFGHHGRPVGFAGDPLATWFHTEDRDAAWAFLQDVTCLLEPPWADLPQDLESIRQASWTLAGLAVVADWLGSDASVFEYVDESMSLTDYWERYARPRARQSVELSGLVAPKTAVAFPGFREEWDFDPTPMQSQAESLPLADGPQLILIEDMTGSGKTEAAWALTQRLLAAGHGDGLYFALPTMATSNAMYARVGAIWRRLYTADSRPSLVLAHGARHLNRAFMESVLPVQPEGGGYGVGEASGSQQCNTWIADSRKRALLADVGVGTIDQALLGLLPRRHQSLRLLGLARKVLVMDEIHAYDAYTGNLLEQLLEVHARQGGSAVLLTATLPIEQRHRLVVAWQRGRGVKVVEDLAEAAFPLLTHVTDERTDELPVAGAPGSGRSLPVDFLDHPDQAMQQVLDAAHQGHCVCWIRNTVNDAIDTRQRLIEAGLPTESITLFHARFTMADRQRIEEEVLARFGKDSGPEARRGRVLIATQVVEQSLDVDFDFLITDLAPIDLLIQRAGRLQRHQRDVDGRRLGRADEDQRPPPRLQVLAPHWSEAPDEDWVRRLLPGTAAVYDDPACLWRTVRLLREFGGIELPRYSRALIEGVYSPDLDDLPEILQEAALAAEGRQRGDKGMARYNSLDLDKGYSLDSAQGWSDDQEIGTRLSDEPSVRVVLLRRRNDGDLAPWHDEVAHPWEMSSVNLRQGQAARLPDLPAELTDEVDQLVIRHPVLRFACLWLADDSNGPSSPGYSSEEGVRVPLGRGTMSTQTESR